jgi:hypothetical protein
MIVVVMRDENERDFAIHRGEHACEMSRVIWTRIDDGDLVGAE